MACLRCCPLQNNTLPRKQRLLEAWRSRCPCFCCVHNHRSVAASSSEEAVCGPAPAAFATGALTPAVVVLHRSAQAGTPGGQPHHQLFWIIFSYVQNSVPNSLAFATVLTWSIGVHDDRTFSFFKGTHMHVPISSKFGPANLIVATVTRTLLIRCV